MNHEDFALKRRQRLISEPYFKWLSGFLVRSIDKWSNKLPANGTDAAPPTADTTSKHKTTATGPSSAKIARVQMSHGWIEAKLSGAVSDQGLVNTILRSGYSRHLLYVPFYLPSAVQHVEALTTGAEHDHADHDLPFTHHYKEGEVEEAVKLKASRIR